jgi:HD-GYP domain-containing protein (c-di-GMP phosphodiesterase class II)
VSVNKKIKQLFQVAEKINREKDFKKIIPLLADLAKELLEVHRMSLFLVDKENQRLYTILAHGVDKIEVPWGTGIVGYVAQHGESLIIPDAYEDPRFNPEVDKKTGYRTFNIIAVPLYNSKGEIIGVFQGINKFFDEFTDEDLDLLTLIAGYAASAIETKFLHDSLKEAYEETIIRLAHASEFKDKETFNHIIRIGYMSELLGKLLGYNEDFCSNIRLASQMHDIGKIGIPDSILLKPDKLDPEEWEVMKSHTIIGYEILKDSKSELLQMAARIALEHHEKYDGTGYPYGKKGEEISIEGRIVALVDVFDALSSKRPYKPVWELNKVIEHIQNLKGKHFDPHVVDVFMQNIDEFDKIREMYRDEE